jgi:hypothetical protein
MLVGTLSMTSLVGIALAPDVSPDMDPCTALVPSA